MERQTPCYMKWSGGLPQAADNDQHHSSRWGLLCELLQRDQSTFPVSYFRGTKPPSPSESTTATQHQTSETFFLWKSRRETSDLGKSDSANWSPTPPKMTPWEAQSGSSTLDSTGYVYQTEFLWVAWLSWNSLCRPS